MLNSRKLTSRNAVNPADGLATNSTKLMIEINGRAGKSQKYDYNPPITKDRPNLSYDIYQIKLRTISKYKQSRLLAGQKLHFRGAQD